MTGWNIELDRTLTNKIEWSGARIFSYATEANKHKRLILAVNSISLVKYLSCWPFKSVCVWRPSIDSRSHVCICVRMSGCYVIYVCVVCTPAGNYILHTGCPLSQERSPIFRYWRCYRQLSIDILASTLHNPNRWKSWSK